MPAQRHRDAIQLIVLGTPRCFPGLFEPMPRQLDMAAPRRLMRG